MKRVAIFLLGCVGCFAVHANIARDYYDKLDLQKGLYLFSISSNLQPQEGCVYQNAGRGILKVCQTVGGYCTVSVNRPDAKLIAIKPTSEYADGVFLREGYYEYVGLETFTDVVGASRKIYAFKEIEPSICAEIDRISVAKRDVQPEIAKSVKLSSEVQHEKTKLAEELEAEKLRVKNERLKLENEREISRLRVAHQKKLDVLAAQKSLEQKELKPKLQKERENYANAVLKDIDFNVKHHYVIQRSIRKMIRKDVEVDPMIAKLANLQAQHDWLGMLSVMGDEEFDEYPKESLIDCLVRNMLQREYVVTFEIDKMAYGLNPIMFISKKCIRVAGGSEERWQEDRTRNPRTIDNREYGQAVATGTYEFQARWRALQNCAYFCRDDHGDSSLSRYAKNVLKKRLGEDLTDSDAESYGEWLKEN